MHVHRTACICIIKSVDVIEKVTISFIKAMFARHSAKVPRYIVYTETKRTLMQCFGTVTRKHHYSRCMYL